MEVYNIHTSKYNIFNNAYTVEGAIEGFLDMYFNTKIVLSTLKFFLDKYCKDIFGEGKEDTIEDIEALPSPSPPSS